MLYSITFWHKNQPTVSGPSREAIQSSLSSSPLSVRNILLQQESPFAEALRSSGSVDHFWSTYAVFSVLAACTSGYESPDNIMSTSIKKMS